MAKFIKVTLREDPKNFKFYKLSKGLINAEIKEITQAVEHVVRTPYFKWQYVSTLFKLGQVPKAQNPMPPPPPISNADTGNSMVGSIKEVIREVKREVGNLNELDMLREQVLKLEEKNKDLQVHNDELLNTLKEFHDTVATSSKRVDQLMYELERANAQLEKFNKFKAYLKEFNQLLS